MERFEKLSQLFISRLMNPIWDSCGDAVNDRWASVLLFLSSYAFERQGRSPDYAPVAVDTIDEIMTHPLCPDIAESAGIRFAEKLNNQRLNHANNPMCPKGTRYTRLFRGSQRQSSIRKISAIQFAAELETPLVSWAREKIQAGKVKEAHSQLLRIGGVHVKIASFFLRDVAVRFNLASAQDRWLLQPVDTWIEFVVKQLSGDHKMDKPTCARFIAENASEPEKANQGIWYFSVPVSGSSRYVVQRCLAGEDNKHYEAAVSRHLSELEVGAEAARAWARKWRPGFRWVGEK